VNGSFKALVLDIDVKPVIRRRWWKARQAAVLVSLIGLSTSLRDLMVIFPGLVIITVSVYVVVYRG